ncbi:MAG: hypothetical protein ACQETE_11875 [Bacteroidota bacterium]
MLSLNYISAAVTAFFIHYIQYENWISVWGQAPSVYLSIIIIGCLFIANFFIYSKSVDTNGVGVSVAAMRLSLLLPVMMSVVWYSEYLSLLGWLGVVLVFIALYLLMPSRSKKQLSSGRISTGLLLILLFLGTGLADSSLKIFEEEWAINLSELEFMGMVFSCSFLFGLLIMAFSKGPFITKKELTYGVLLGLPNLYSSIFLIYALQELNGAVAFTVVNLLNVAGGTLLGKLRWNDSVSQLQWIGLGIALISITLLIV